MILIMWDFWQGRLEKEVSKVYLALDATETVIDKAIALGTDMLITHHPLIFSPMKRVTDEDFIGRRVVKLLQNDISYYAMHTNYDVLWHGEAGRRYSWYLRKHMCLMLHNGKRRSRRRNRKNR